MLSVGVSASAVGIEQDECQDQVVEYLDEEGLVLVSEEEIVLEDGQVAEVKTFFEDGVETYSSTSGHKKYTCVAQFKNTVNQVIVKIIVKGTFYWNSSTNRAYIEEDDGDYSIESPYFEYVSEEYKHGSDQGGSFGGRKYAYAQQSVTYLNNLKKKNTCTLKFKVFEDGEPKWDTKLATNDVSVT